MNPGGRVRITSPETDAALRTPSAPGRRRSRVAVQPPDTPVTLAAVHVSLRVQRRLALRTMALLGLGVLAVPVLLQLPWARVRVGDVPVSWLVLGAGLYPVLLGLAHWHRRAVERLEAALGAPEPTSGLGN